jgi:hypothetical protein
MGLNLIWYVLMWLLSIGGLVFTARLDYGMLRLLFHNWDWGFFISPSAYLFFALLPLSITVPVTLLCSIPRLFIRDENGGLYKHRFLWSFLLFIAGIPAVQLIILLLMWGSFQLGVDAQNNIHLRLLPFIPWPDWGLLALR